MAHCYVWRWEPGGSKSYSLVVPLSHHLSGNFLPLGNRKSPMNRGLNGKNNTSTDFGDFPLPWLPTGRCRIPLSQGFAERREVTLPIFLRFFTTIAVWPRDLQLLVSPVVAFDPRSGFFSVSSRNTDLQTLKTSSNLFWLTGSHNCWLVEPMFSRCSSHFSFKSGEEWSGAFCPSMPVSTWEKWWFQWRCSSIILKIPKFQTFRTICSDQAPIAHSFESLVP